MKRTFFWVVLSISLIGLLSSSCITPRKVNYMQPPGMGVPAYHDSVSYEDYRIKPDDRLYLRVYSIDDRMNYVFNGSSRSTDYVLRGGGSAYQELYTYLVEEDGSLILPHLGNVFVGGKTLREAESYLEEKLKPYFKLNEVDIDLRIVGRYYSIIGQSASGRFELPREKINIFQALAQAGDIGIYGDRSRIRILRETPEGPVVKVFDIRSADIIHSEFYYVEPSDVIYIQNMYEQVFGITSLASLLGILVSTFSLVSTIYILINLNK
ncbi:hypothetical protein D0T49_04015 [Paludibacter sp. 221]|uniref:polysaccharide biosynthesis/export family protein n=1 Tax=Paludibacter sp. 221 TaxID=2302939 RepID=UPI0013D4CFA4|nr:polysaccharide biosynthesis/export family protein [Paludibacter sp. 221]NDV46206.1 hypothetical protein [Paludibacter sp. 221]